MTRLRAVLALLLVPVVIVATPGVGNAANYNGWHKLSVTLDNDDALVNVTPTSCEFPARYDSDGSGVSVGAGKCWSSALDGPGQQVPEPGTGFVVAFKGQTSGTEEYGEGEFTGSANCGWGTHVTQVTCTTSVTTPRYPDPRSFFPGQDYVSYVVGPHDVPPTSANWGSAYKRFSWAKADTNTYLDVGTNRPAAGAAVSIKGIWIAPGIEPSWAGSQRLQLENAVRVGTLYIVPQGGTLDQPEGQPGGLGGDGVPCSASYSGTLADHPDNGFVGLAGTLPAGAAVFDLGAGSGFCHVTDVCVTLEADSWAGTATHSSCKGSEWGAPWQKEAPDETDVDAPAPVPDTADPIEAPADETSWWVDVLEALADLAGAIGSLAGKILDGLIGLFVPSPGFMEQQGEALKDAWSDTPPLVVLDGVQDLGDSLVIEQPPGACAGPSLDFATEMTGPVSLSPLSTCRSEVGTLASIIKTALTVVVYVGAFLAGVRIIGSAFGVDLSMSKGGETI